MEVTKALDLFRTLRRRKLWLLVPVLLGLGVALAALKNIDPKYEARAVLQIERQKIPTDFVEDTVTAAVVERLRTIEQQIRNADVLEEIIRELNAYPELVDQGLMNEAVGLARRALTVDENQRQRTVSIGFVGTEPSLVADFANKVAEYVIEENTRLREVQAQGTTAFVDAQIEEARGKLREMAEAIAVLKKRWDGRLPEQRDRNQAALSRLERGLESAEDRIRTAETRRLLLQRTGTVAAQRVGPGKGVSRPTRADQLRQELRELESRYTEKHPDVIRVRKELQAAERSEKMMPVIDPEANSESNASADPILVAELEALDIEVARLQGERRGILVDISRYQQRLQGVPHVEQQLASLQREYDNFQGYYSSLLKKRIEAQLGENLEERQQSEQFSMLERAKPPWKPYSPKPLLFLFLGVSVGGVLGVGLVLLKEETDQSFRDPDALKDVFPGVAVLSVIPDLTDRSALAYQRQKKRKATA